MLRTWTSAACRRHAPHVEAAVLASHGQLPFRPWQSRGLLTLAIETSCDDTSVAVLEKDTLPSGAPRAKLLFHEKITADNSQFRGIHPLHSLESHQTELPGLLSRALQYLPRRSPQASFDPATCIAVPAPPSSSSSSSSTDDGSRELRLHQKPDFVTATRGPGMRSSLSAGLDLAKGLCLAWNVPLVGAHHMQAHALTPRLVSALAAGAESTVHKIREEETAAAELPQRQRQQEADTNSTAASPAFPFLSLLVSGGHTLLLSSSSLTSHRTLATTTDIALGDAIDKLARALLPAELLASTRDTSYGRLLEQYTFPTTTASSDDAAAAAEATADMYAYRPPHRRHEALQRYVSEWGWTLSPPLAETKNGARTRAMEFSFSGLDSAVRRTVAARDGDSSGGDGDAGAVTAQQRMSERERRALAREAMRLCFEHCASRVVMALEQEEEQGAQTQTRTQTLVLSGGVAANRFLRHVVRAYLDAWGWAHVRLAFPPPELCTDNAAMVAWAGLEMWEAGWRSEMGCLPEKRWPLERVLEVGGWERRKAE